ncbi:MAG: DNA gyrase inhibitor YacG [Gammaproteobacteria bacterium]|nr:DNA gyrase inhibitor YacG [Gammaproteobacteria bacterium]
MPVRTVACPNCGARVEWQPENRYRPFCSERCRMADLGAWANEQYRVPVPADDPDKSFEGADRET